MIFNYVVCCLFIAELVVASFHNKINNNILQTTYGPVRGFQKDGVQYFLGVPFAASPVGQLRWRPPTPPTAWSTPIDGTQHRSMCLQGGFIGLDGSEDCLYLDIYMPVNVTTPLSIMIWIYGGGFNNGDKYFGGLYDATNFVKARPHIHVAMNYRLGPFGFFALDELFKESGTTGNYGLQDQRMAMQFVHDNAAALGGDVSRVTIFGESAGALSVCAHLVSPASKGLFTSAIMESGNCGTNDLFQPLANNVAYANVYVNNLGCENAANRLDCLRSISADNIMNGNVTNMNHTRKFSPVLPWAATIDGAQNGLLGNPLTLMQQGKFNRVPTVAGTDQNEGVLFVLAALQITGSFPWDRQNTRALAAYLWNDTVADMALAMYDHLDTYPDIVAAAITDWWFTCVTRRSMLAMQSYGAPVYLYQYSFIPDWIDDWLLGDYHSSEIELVYGNPWPAYVHSFDADDRKIVAAFQNYWMSLNEFGHPNGYLTNNMPHWPRYESVNKTNVRIDLPLLLEQDFRATYCGTLWDKVRA